MMEKFEAEGTIEIDYDSSDWSSLILIRKDKLGRTVRSDFGKVLARHFHAKPLGELGDYRLLDNVRITIESMRP